MAGNNYEVTISGIYLKNGNSTEIKYKVNMFDITSVKASTLTLNPTSMSLTFIGAVEYYASLDVKIIDGIDCSAENVNYVTIQITNKNDEELER